MPEVRVRFAPSPTGFLHVGGARTALFNWLYARKHDGTFVLRIEDTDRQRSSDEMVQAILDGLEWLGLSPDEGPFFQSQARAKHIEDGLRLQAEGRAYRCFCTPESIREHRQRAEKSGGDPRYPRTCRGLSATEAERRVAAGEPFAVRFAVPDERVEWHDKVHGTTGFDADTLEDFVVLRSDGTPTYMLSVVSDDIDMEITHVLRGDDHLSNTPKQILLYRALGHEPPVFAHLPLILGPDRRRLSKRHGAVSLLEYRDQGYLPEAMLNFLALLGWSPGDDREKLGRRGLVEAFDLGGVGRSGAVFDLDKLRWLNGQYLAERPAETLIPHVRDRLERAGLWRDEYDGEARGWLLRTIRLLQGRCRVLDDFVEQGRPFFNPSDELVFDDRARQKHLKDEHVAEHLEALRKQFADVEPWEADPLERALRTLAESREIPAGKLIHPARLAVTGKGASPGLFEVLELLGRERTLARLDRLLADLNGRAS